MSIYVSHSFLKHKLRQITPTDYSMKAKVLSFENGGLKYDVYVDDSGYLHVKETTTAPTSSLFLELTYAYLKGTLTVADYLMSMGYMTGDTLPSVAWAGTIGGQPRYFKIMPFRQAENKLIIYDSGYPFLWRSLLIIDADAGEVILGGSPVYVGLMPQVHDAHVIGSATKRWKEGHFKDLYAGSSLIVPRLASDPSLAEGLLWLRTDLDRLRYSPDGLTAKTIPLKLDDIEDVEVPSPSDGQVLTYEAATALWKNKTPSAAVQDWAVMELVEPTSNVDYVDFTNLDINTHKFYVLFITIKNNASAAANYNLWVEGDYNAGNYYHQWLLIAGSSITAMRTNAPRIEGLAVANKGIKTVYITRDVDGRFRYDSRGSRYEYGSNEINEYSGCKLQTVTNITSIRVEADQPGGIGAGSKLMLCRMRYA